jgi:hypothetical protein
VCRDRWCTRCLPPRVPPEAVFVCVCVCVCGSRAHTRWSAASRAPPAAVRVSCVLSVQGCTYVCMSVRLCTYNPGAIRCRAQDTRGCGTGEVFLFAIRRDLIWAKVTAVRGILQNQHLYCCFCFCMCGFVHLVNYIRRVICNE